MSLCNSSTSVVTCSEIIVVNIAQTYYKVIQLVLSYPLSRMIFLRIENMKDYGRIHI